VHVALPLFHDNLSNRLSARDRREALAACREAIETLKERVPLCEEEVYEVRSEWIAGGS
jgi:molybdopterin synthase catalytic subunit